MKLLKKKVPSWMRPEIEWVVHEFLVIFASYIVTHSTAFHSTQTLRSLQGFQKKLICFTIPTRWMKVQYFSLIMNMNNTHRSPLLRSYLSTLHSAWDTPCVCVWVISVEEGRSSELAPFWLLVMVVFLFMMERNEINFVFLV